MAIDPIDVKKVTIFLILVEFYLAGPAHVPSRSDLTAITLASCNVERLQTVDLSKLEFLYLNLNSF